MRRDRRTGKATAQEHPESTLARFDEYGKTASATVRIALTHASVKSDAELDLHPTALNRCFFWIQSHQTVFGADKPFVVHRFIETEREANPRLADGGEPIGDKLFEFGFVDRTRGTEDFGNGGYHFLPRGSRLVIGRPAARLFVQHGQCPLNLFELSLACFDLTPKFVKVGLDAGFLGSEFVDSGCESLGHHWFSFESGKVKLSEVARRNISLAVGWFQKSRLST
jgi:hypothetical protein